MKCARATVRAGRRGAAAWTQLASSRLGGDAQRTTAERTRDSRLDPLSHPALRFCVSSACGRSRKMVEHAHNRFDDEGERCACTTGRLLRRVHPARAVLVVVSAAVALDATGPLARQDGQVRPQRDQFDLRAGLPISVIADSAPAAEWDTPAHRATAKQAADAILAHLHEHTRGLPEDIDRPLHEWDVLEIGCGTGLLSTYLAPQVRSLLGVDTSRGMIDVFNTKTRAHPNMRCCLGRSRR